MMGTISTAPTVDADELVFVTPAKVLSLKAVGLSTQVLTAAAAGELVDSDSDGDDGDDAVAAPVVHLDVSVPDTMVQPASSAADPDDLPDNVLAASLSVVDVAPEGGVNSRFLQQLALSTSEVAELEKADVDFSALSDSHGDSEPAVAEAVEDVAALTLLLKPGMMRIVDRKVCGSIVGVRVVWVSTVLSLLGTNPKLSIDRTPSLRVCQGAAQNLECAKWDAVTEAGSYISIGSDVAVLYHDPPKVYYGRIRRRGFLKGTGSITDVTRQVPAWRHLFACAFGARGMLKCRLSCALTPSRRGSTFQSTVCLCQVCSWISPY
jgi:hypothetical protein